MHACDIKVPPEHQTYPPTREFQTIIVLPTIINVIMYTCTHSIDPPVYPTEPSTCELQQLYYTIKLLKLLRTTIIYY